MLKLDRDKPAVEKLWRRHGFDEKHTDSLHCVFSTPYLDGDYVYGVDSYGELRCLDAATGDRVWESLEAGPQVPLGHDPHGPQRRKDLDVQRAGRAAHRRADARGISRNQPGPAHRADAGTVGSPQRRLLVASRVCQSASLRPQRRGAGAAPAWSRGRIKAAWPARRLRPARSILCGSSTRSTTTG